MRSVKAPNDPFWSLSSLQSPSETGLGWVRAAPECGDKTWDRKICYKWKCPSSSRHHRQPQLSANIGFTLALGEEWSSEDIGDISDNCSNRQPSTMKVRKLVSWPDDMSQVTTSMSLCQCLWIILSYSSVFRGRLFCLCWPYPCTCPAIAYYCLVLTC